MSLKHSLPKTLQRFLPKELMVAPVVETKATCDSCAMAPGKSRSRVHYNPHLKCCTFYPFQPNFSLGAILSQDGIGKQVVLKMIEQRQFTLPVGSVAPPQYQKEFYSKGKLDFGNRQDLLCPYFNLEQENCNIWQQRSSVCTSFICKSSYGKAGLKFWQNLGHYLHYVEMALMEELLAHLDFSPRQVSEQMAYINNQTASPQDELKEKLDAKVYRRLWNHYDNEVDFYKKCFQMSQKMTRKDLLQVMGEPGRNFEDELCESLQVLAL